MRNTIAILGACALLFGCKSKQEQAPEQPTTEQETAPMEQPSEEQAGQEEAPTQQMAPGEGRTVVDVAMSDPRFSTFASALQTAGLTETLKGEGPFTVFAPTNDAFNKIPKDQLDALMADKEKLSGVLKHHVLDKKVSSSELSGQKSVDMIDGSSLQIDTTEGVKIGDARVEQPDIEASNGVIHAIDTVLMPKE